MCGSNGRTGGGAEGRRDDHRVEGGGRGNRWSPVATQDPIKKDGKMADLLLGRPRAARKSPGTDRKKGGRSQTGKPSEVTQSLSPRLLPFSA